MIHPSRAVALVLASALLASACAGGSTETVESVLSAETAAEIEDLREPAVATTAPVAEPPTAEDESPEAVEPAPVEADEPVTAEPAEPEPAQPASVEPAAEAAPPEEATLAAVAPTLPQVEVVDLLTGASTDLSGLARPGPTLVWFWAPH